MQASAVHNFDIIVVQHRDDTFILATDFEKVLDIGSTGLNTRANVLISVSLTYKDKCTAVSGVYPRLADRIHIVPHSDQILEIRDSGCQVFD